MVKKVSKEERRKALKERTQNKIKNKQTASFGNKILNLSDYEDVNWYKPETDVKSKISILPYITQTKNIPGDEIGFESYGLDIWVHRFIGPANGAYVCLEKTYGKACPICDEIKNIQNDDAITEKEAKKLIRSLTPTRRCFYNIIDMDNEEKGIQIFDVSYFLFEKHLLIAAETEEDEYVTFADLEEGRIVKFLGKKVTKDGMTFIEFYNFSFGKREPFDDDILDEVYPFDKMLNVLSYDEIKAAFLDEDEEETDNVREEIKEEPRKSKKESKNLCPHGHKYGNDCDEKDDCEECVAWEACADKQEELEND